MTTRSDTRRLGDRTVGAIGLGAMPMSLDPPTDRGQALRTIHAALDAGVTLIDTADAYSPGGSDAGHNERLVAEGVRTWGGDRSGVVIATKGGHTRRADGSWATNGRPEHLKEACEASSRALGLDVLDLYQLHRPDPDVPFEESVGALADLLAAGKIRAAGLSNVTIAQIDAACRILPVTSVQNELSLRFRSSISEVAHCQSAGIAFLAWSPLGGVGAASAIGSEHTVLARIAAKHRVSPQRVALAWALSLASVVIPIPGASRPETVRDSAMSASLDLDDEDLLLLEETT